MAGRGRRLGYAERSVPLRRPGAPSSSLGDDSVDVQMLMNKIGDITGSIIDPLLLNDIETVFKQLCVNKDSLVQVLSNLHLKSLCDNVFGDKVVIIMEHIAAVEIDNSSVRNEFLKFLQNDYLVKDTMSQSDSLKFMNAVSLLGGVYSKVQVQGKPLAILGVALLDYLELLLQGDEDHLKMLAKQIFLNGANITSEPKLEQKFELLKHSLRKTLVSRNLSSLSRCWLLLILDLISNNFQPCKGTIRDFYLANIGDDYLELESISTKPEPTQVFPKPRAITKSVPEAEKYPLEAQINHLELREEPPVNIKSEVDNIRQKMRAQGIIPEKKHFDDRKNRKWQDGEKLSDDEKIWGLKETNGAMSGHDDRCQRDDDFYGIQLPRNAKPRKIQGRNGDKAGMRKSLDADWKLKSDSTDRGEDSWD